MHPRLHIVFVALLLTLQTIAREYPFIHYTAANGLGASTLNHIFQDSKGYIWLATQGGGVSRFDGKEFTTYSRADGLISNDVTCIAQNADGKLWFGTAEGASLFDGKTFANCNAKTHLTSGVVYSIYCSEAVTYFATQDDGVIQLVNGKFSGLANSDTTNGISYYTIAAGKNGSLFFGTSSGIAKLQNGRLKNIQLPSLQLQNKTWFGSVTDKEGNIWFGSTTGNLICIKPDHTVQSVTLPDVNQKDFIGSITQDLSGNLWLATDHGLLKYDGKTFQSFDETNGLSVNAVQTVFADYENNIWAGTLNGGLNLLRSEAFVRYNQKDGLSAINVTAIAQHAGTNRYFVATTDGLFVSNTQTPQSFKKVGSVKEAANANITSLAFDRTQQLWMTTQDGVLVLKETQGQFHLAGKITEANSQRLISPQKVLADAGGNIWIATFGSGLIKINSTETKTYNTASGFCSDKILTLFEDSRQNIYIGTLDAGLVKYDGAGFSPVSIRKGAGGEVKAVWSITEDNYHNLLVGTGEHGLFIYSNGVCKNINTQSGLQSNYIPALHFSKSSNAIWLAGEKGLSELQLTAQHEVKALHHYNQKDGFAASVNQHAVLPTADGSLWLGTTNGLWQFDASQNFSTGVPPKIQLADVKLFFGREDIRPYQHTTHNQKKSTPGLFLPYNKNHLTFHVRALTTSTASYVYKLEGSDADWSLPAANSEITYSNIAPGNTYIFHAKAINAQGLESVDEILYRITVEAPWWKTTWFYWLASVVISLALYTFIKTRERVLRQQNIKLEATVKERTQEIELQKQTIEKALDEKEILLKEIHHRVKNNLQTISSMLMLQSAGLKDEQAKKAITESQSRVRSIALVHQKLYQTDGLQKVELHAFAKDLINQIQSLYRKQSKSVNIRLQIPETNLVIDKAIPLGLILNELITNSFKYAFTDSVGGEIYVSLTQVKSSELTSKSKRVQLIYRDTGSGLSSPEVLENASTLGLRLVKLLSQQIGATLNYSNTNGSEFIFTFTINV